MTKYVGLDVSQKTTVLCVVDGEGHRLWRGECTSSPDQIVHTVLHVKSFDANRARALLGARQQLVGMVTGLSNHIRGVLKTFGMLPGPGEGADYSAGSRWAAEGNLHEPVVDIGEPALRTG